MQGVSTSTPRKAIVSLILGLALMFAMAMPASAQVQQDGLVNVNVGDITILEDVNIGVAAQVAANICGVRVGPVAVLGTTVDRTGTTRTVCETDQGDVTISQN